MDITRVTIDPLICGGKPAIKGTRIMVRNILGMIAGGYDIHKILSEYPELTREDISEALQYTVSEIDEEEVIRRA